MVSKAQGAKPGILTLDDSKEIFQSGHADVGKKRLEDALLCLGIAESPNFWSSIRPHLVEGAETLDSEFWIGTQDPFPMGEVSQDRRDAIAGFLAKASSLGMESWKVACRVIVPRGFNERVEKAGTKAAVLLDGIEQFCQWAAQLSGPGTPREIVVDKLGGRDRYGPWLGSATGGWITVTEEGPQASAYRIIQPEGDWTIRFESKADFHHMTVAMASMVAKTIREISMDQFNAFWNRHLPELKPTAGYPQDAKRYLKEIEPLLPSLNLPMEHLWRSK